MTVWKYLGEAFNEAPNLDIIRMQSVRTIPMDKHSCLAITLGVAMATDKIVFFEHVASATAFCQNTS